MAIPAATGSTHGWLRYGDLPEGQRLQVEASVRALPSSSIPASISAPDPYGLSRKLGDTLLLTEGDSRVAGFALCHFGRASEAGDGNLFVKFGAAMPGPDAERRFVALLDACVGFGAAVGMTNVVAGVNTAREAAYRAMKRAGSARNSRASRCTVPMSRGTAGPSCSCSMTGGSEEFSDPLGLVVTGADRDALG